MEYFKHLQALLRIEKEADQRTFKELTENMPVQERRANGLSWYPIAIRDTEIGAGDYLSVEVERTTHTDVIHQLRFGMTAALFSNHDAKADRVEGTITYIGANRLKISLRTDELPEWSRNGKLGIDAVFDQNSYEEMEYALKLAAIREKEEDRLVQILTGAKHPTSNSTLTPVEVARLNTSQQAAVNKIVQANELAIVHGPPGTGKTTTLVHAIKALAATNNKPILVVAPSNAAVDLLSERLHDEGLNVVRVGNPSKVSEKQLALTLDSKSAAHPSHKEIKRLKKQAAEYRNMAHKYKRSFGYAEREQRKALFTEARNIGREVERTEQYITDDIISKANVITATLVGSNHYTVRQLKYNTVVIDEAGQALEPACWIPVLKAEKVIMAGDHCQLPPTIKSMEAARGGLGTTLMEKLVALHPEAVVLLEEQYRMHEDIMGFSGQTFYGNRLVAHTSVAKHLLHHSQHPFTFIDTAGCGFEEKREGTRLSNPEEAAFVLQYLSTLAETIQESVPGAPFPTTAIISPYKQQVELLKDLALTYPVLQQVKESITVNTIDSFQGQERDLVAISMTRTNTENNIGFLSDIRRMNVAMTRARKKLVIVGDSATLSVLPFYANLIDYSQEKGGYVSAWEFLN